MHEWALADGVVATAVKAAEKEGVKRITKINIKVGEVQQIDIDCFKFALKELMQPYRAMFEHTELVMTREPAILKCRNCSNEWAFSEATKKLNQEESESIHFLPEIAHVYIRCPVCHSPDFEVARGRGVWIDTIEGE